MALVVVRMTVLSASRLRDVWDHLHAARNNARWSTTTSSICRSCRSTKPFSQLFHQCLSDVVSSDVNCISYTENN